MNWLNLEGYFAVLEIDIAWGEMDSYQHVNNVAYFRYIESARIQYLTEIGWDEFERKGIWAVLGSVEAKFIRPVVFPDRIAIGTRPLELSQQKMIVEHRIVSRSSAGETVSVGKSVIVPFHRDGFKVDVPSVVVDRVRAQLATVTLDNT